MVEIEIKHITKKYAKYLFAHLQKEHPTTKGKIKIEKPEHKKRRK